MISQDKKLRDKISIIVNHYNAKNFNKVISESNRILKKILLLIFYGIF